MARRSAAATAVRLIAALNREVCDDVGSTGMFITAISVHYRPADRTLTLANAGHNPALLHTRAAGTVQAIDSDGPPLGFADAATFGQQCRELSPGDLLLVHTDGITEATNPELEMYGDERLRRTLTRLAGACTTAQQVLDALLADLHAFCAGQPLNDDLTLLVVACR